ncbi:MAG: hypothetical protein KY460_10680 [Actinobacteria bacterium]|nr:hypothetical protein [Actinomycetota bacterium]
MQQRFVASGLGVTTMPGLALRTHRSDGVKVTELTGIRRRVYIASYGEPPDPPATAAFITALTDAAAAAATAES